MTDHVEQEERATYEVIIALFSGRPAGASELRERLMQTNRALVRRLVVERLRSDALPDQDGPVILAVLDVVGVGREKQHLSEIALNTAAQPRVRMWAAMALARDDPRMMDLLIMELGPEGMAHLAENALIELITLQSPDQVGGTITRALEEWHRDLSSEALLMRIESCRRGLVVSCTEAYGEALVSQRLASLRGRILELFILEASEDGIAMLESVRTQAESESGRRELQAAILRMRSNRIDPSSCSVEPTGYAVVSNCDGQGGFIVLGVFDNDDGTHTVSELYIHVDGDIHDGVVHPRVRFDDFSSLAAHLQIDNACSFARTSLPECAALVMSALGRASRSTPQTKSETARAISLFQRVTPEFSWGDEPLAIAAEAISEEEIQSLLTRPEYTDTWLFDTNELESLGFPLQESAETIDTWLNREGKAIASSSLKRRVSAMAAHMTLWHLWNNEPDWAAVLMAVSREVEERFVESTLFRVMLNRSVEWSEE